jgi:hypothetical protein
VRKDGTIVQLSDAEQTAEETGQSFAPLLYSIAAFIGIETSRDKVECTKID